MDDLSCALVARRPGPARRRETWVAPTPTECCRPARHAFDVLRRLTPAPPTPQDLRIKRARRGIRAATADEAARRIPKSQGGRQDTTDGDRPRPGGGASRRRRGAADAERPDGATRGPAEGDGEGRASKRGEAHRTFAHWARTEAALVRRTGIGEDRHAGVAAAAPGRRGVRRTAGSVRRAARPPSRPGSVHLARYERARGRRRDRHGEWFAARPRTARVAATAPVLGGPHLRAQVRGWRRPPGGDSSNGRPTQRPGLGPGRRDDDGSSGGVRPTRSGPNAPTRQAPRCAGGSPATTQPQHHPHGGAGRGPSRRARRGCRPRHRPLVIKVGRGLQALGSN